MREEASLHDHLSFQIRSLDQVNEISGRSGSESSSRGVRSHSYLDVGSHAVGSCGVRVHVSEGDNFIS